MQQPGDTKTYVIPPEAYGRRLGVVTRFLLWFTSYSVLMFLGILVANLVFKSLGRADRIFRFDAARSVQITIHCGVHEFIRSGQRAASFTTDRKSTRLNSSHVE